MVVPQVGSGGQRGGTDVRRRLLYLVGQLRAGGSERQLVSLLGRLDRARYRPEVAVWNFDARDAHVTSIQRLDVPLHAGPHGGSRLVKLMWVRRLVRELRPEMIHSYSFFTNFAAQFGAWGRLAVAVGSRRSDLRAELMDGGPLVGRLSGRWPRAQICNSRAAAERARREANGLFSPRTLLVVCNGVDLESFRPVPPPRSFPRRIVGVGSLVRLKRWDRFLLAARDLRAQGLDFFMEVVGEGPLHQVLEAEARALGVAERVRFVGFSFDVPDALARSAFLVHTSDIEGCPNVILEAMASGRAVVATDAGETPYLVEDGKTGFVVSRGDDATLVERMAMLIRDGNLCRKMGEAGRIKAEREFGLDRLAAETLEAYRAFGWQG